MTQRTIWIITVILLTVHLIIQYSFFSTIDLSGKSGMYTIVGDIITNIFLVFFVVLVIVPLIALIPFKGMVYNEKFLRLVPLATSTVLIVLIANFGYLAYLKKVKNITVGPLHKYEDIQIPLNLDCQKVHNGKFETEKFLVERNGRIQIQTDMQTGNIKEFNVEWISECEYTLTPKVENSEKLKIKITAVNTDNYGCYVLSDRYPDKYPNFVTLKILNK